MYLLYAPTEKFGRLSDGQSIFCRQVQFYNNVALCHSQYFLKHHIIAGCLDISPKFFVKLRKQTIYRRVVMFARGGFGDSSWVMPFAKSFKQHYPQCEIIIITDAKNIPLWKNCSYISQIVADTWEMKDLYINNADEVFDFGGIVTVFEKLKKNDPIESIFYCGGLPLPENKKDCRPAFFLDSSDFDSTKKLCEDNFFDYENETYCVIATESSTPNRDYPFEHILSLCEKLVTAGIRPVLLSTKESRLRHVPITCSCGFSLSVHVPQIVSKHIISCPNCHRQLDIACPDYIKKIVDLSQKTNIRNVLTLCASADCVVAPNSFVMVAATSFMTPTVGLFGAFHPKNRTKFYENFVSLWGKIHCSPCNEHWTHCQRGKIAPCMCQISPDEVFDNILFLIENFPKSFRFGGKL